QPSKDFAERVIHYPALAESIDRSIDPCKDFYSFVCNGWIKSHPIPENQFQYTQTELSKEKIIKEVKDILVTLPPYTAREDNLMRIFYQKCQPLIRNTEEVMSSRKKKKKGQGHFILEETEFNTDSITVTVGELRQTLGTIDWVRYATAFLPSHLRYSVAKRPVRITKLATIQRLQEVLLSMDDQTLSDYLDWKVIFHFGDFVGEGFQRLMEEFTKQVYGVTGIDRIDDCVSLTMNTFYDIAGRRYLERYFNFDSVFLVKELVEDVRAAFLEMLSKNEWMDANTKKRARRKANAIRDFIGYDNGIFNDTLRKIRYKHLSYTAANSYYDISMAIHQWMMESAFLKLDKVNSRGTFDTSVMEVNAFYDGNKNQIGASYDEFGNKNDWWDEATYKNFERKKQCFDHQYGSISVNDLNVQIDGRRTEGENIADNGGMRAAIRAALRLSERTSERFTIAGLEDFSQMHYFFMNYAFIWCGSARRATLLNKLANDVHAPDMYRVNVVLSNQPEFAKTFPYKPRDVHEYSKWPFHFGTEV
ncbi:peptidase family M13, partial [Teladorsagia circumcincta]